MSSFMTASLALLKRDIGLMLAKGSGPIMASGFYLTLMAMIPLSLGPDGGILSQIAPGLAWLCLALTSLLSLERLFERDFEDGVFDIFRLGPLPLEWIALLKALSQWVGTGLLLALMTPFVMIIFGGKIDMAVKALMTAILGSVCFSLIGSVGAALCLGTRKGGVLMALLVLPLYIPPVIFGAANLGGISSAPQSLEGLYLLSAYSLFALALSPLAAGLALKHALT